MNFYEFIQTAINENEPRWDYYGTGVIDVSRMPECSLEFIKSYFENGSKEYAFFENNLEEESYKLSKYRSVHTVSAFFLGIMLQDRITKGTNELEISIGNECFSFSYLWYLTCLYHDYGYIIEENISPQLPKRRKQEEDVKNQNSFNWTYLDKVKKQLGITISPYQKNYRKISQEVRTGTVDNNQYLLYQLLETASTVHEKMTFNGEIKIDKHTYSSSLVADYFAYCIHELTTPIYNHGIIGGYLFYDRMIKNYIKAYGKSAFNKFRNEQFQNLENFNFQGRNFCIQQIPLFAYIADCIIAHNIWKASKKDEERYLIYDLQKLVGESFRKISFKNNPLLFILVLVDTIEPFKVYGSSTNAGKDVLPIWQAIDFDFHEGILTVKTVSEKYPVNELYSRAEGLKSWVDIDRVCKNEDGKSFYLKIV